MRPCDAMEEQLVTRFAIKGCGCKKKCSSQFCADHFRDMRAQCYELSHSELDMVLLGQPVASTNSSDGVVIMSGRLKQEKRKQYTIYHHAGKTVCGKTFQFPHTVGKKRLKNLAKSLKDNGLSPRVHGNTKKRPKHSLSFESTEYVLRFLLSYAEQSGLLLPGRVPGYSRSDIKLLPSSISKRGIWKIYCTAAAKKVDTRAVAYTTFCRLWRLLLPSVIIMKPMTDLCWVCHQNSTAILRAANSTLKKAEEHLRLVQVERSYYKTKCDESRESIRSFFTTDAEFRPPPLSSNITPNSNNIKAHYSFYYAQQIHFPSDPLQPGPIYFLTPRKYTVFGIHCEAIPRQVNFLTDEAGECGKGANNVVSHLHYYLESHGLGEITVPGKTKKNCMI